MTGITNRYGIYEVDHTTFGGIITLSDFFTNCSGKSNTRSPIAARIEQDRNFDRMCQRNTLNKRRKH